MPALQTVLPLPLRREERRSPFRLTISVKPPPAPFAISALSWRSWASRAAKELSASACSNTSCVRWGTVDDEREFPWDELGVSTILEAFDDDRRKKEKRPVGVGAVTGVGGTVLTAPGVEKLFTIGGNGDAGDGGFSMPISFMVAARRSRSRRSSSSSKVSSLRAPVTMGGAPAFSVSGRKFGVGGGAFFLSLPNIENDDQSNERDLREARVDGAALGGSFSGRGEVGFELPLMLSDSKVVSRSVGGAFGLVWAVAGVEREKMAV